MGCNQSKVAPYTNPDEENIKNQKRAPKIAGWQRFKAFWRRNKVQPLLINVQSVTSDELPQTTATAPVLVTDKSTPQTVQATVDNPSASHTSLVQADRETNQDAKSQHSLGPRTPSPSPSDGDVDIEHCVQPIPDLTVTGTACSSAPSLSTKVGGGSWRTSPADTSSAPAASSTQKVSGIIADRQVKSCGLSYQFFDPRDGFGMLKNPPAHLTKLKTRKHMTDEERVNLIKNKMEIARHRQELIKTEMEIKFTEQGMRAAVNFDRAKDVEAHKATMASIKLQAKHQRMELNQEEQKINQMVKANERQRRHLAVQEGRNSPLSPSPSLLSPSPQ